MALLDPDPTLIAPEPAPEPSPDRAPAELAAGTPEPLRSDLVGLLGADRALTRPSDLIRYASDASPYRRFPKAVVMARETGDVAKLFDYGRRTGTSLTFRAGGTSLNGQSQTDSILVDVRRHFAGIEVLDGGARARVGPGTVLSHANRVLAPHGRKLGPDPASAEAATIGGVVANNSGGMRCGTVHDSYRTVSAMRFLLPSGTEIDTAAPGAAGHFASAEPELAHGLERIRDEIRSDAALAERIARKFTIKNTMGYRLCAFLDADQPLEIFRRLIVGSEGTLAFIAEVTFETIAPGRHATTALIHFADVDAAAAAVPPLVAAGSTATELIGAAMLTTAARKMRGTPQSWSELDPGTAAILVEFRGDEKAELEGLEQRARAALSGHEPLSEPTFTRDPELTETYWRVREGMFGLVGSMRKPGQALITEDVCVPPERVAEAARGIRELLVAHGFLPGVAGHASAGNLHFTLTPDFSLPGDVDRYESLIAAVADLVLDGFDGSLKAEHGTGVNMAPYLEREWGGRATELMWELKRLADPDGILSPGVILNRDPSCHLRDLKATPAIERVATKCVECGMCEPVCPSRDLTLTPRQRIVLRREMARQPAGSPLLEALVEEYQYDGLETCAADGSCAPACPIGIDTGALVKQMRGAQRSDRAEATALRLARRWRALERGARAALRVGSGAGAPVVGAAAGAARSLLGDELVPSWPRAMPRPAPARLPATRRDGAAAVYLPACINRIFGSPRDEREALPVPAALVAVSARAGYPVWIPDGVAGRCCAQPWVSKGYERGARWMVRQTVAALWEWSGRGSLPIVCDAASCTLGLGDDARSHLDEAGVARLADLVIIDAIEWAHGRLLGALAPARAGSIAIHPPCSAAHLGLEADLGALAGALADEVRTAASPTCCGFAGDRGLLHPELTASATAREVAELGNSDVDARLCGNRTCEIGLELATGSPWRSPIQQLELATRGA